MQRALGKRV
jgi:mRNA-degrading endonuclease RelE of RelBE toxin-antitoxin system